MTVEEILIAGIRATNDRLKTMNTEHDEIEKRSEFIEIRLRELAIKYRRDERQRKEGGVILLIPIASVIYDLELILEKSKL